ncbi:MAG: hypothetical protein E6J47_00575 [Chloroflexi bacterium]|nr:MAG: hypothetical protein E6J47_00575 [Chloroflexota bacterium]
MAEPVVFISHFRVKEGGDQRLREGWTSIVAQLEPTRPRTLMFELYADGAHDQATIVHVFADADAMDRHFEGADERSRAIYEYIQPTGWEIYGQASPAAVEQMQREAAESGVSLTVQAEPMGGFLRLAPSTG